jgi:hypothetical protein
MTIEPAQSHPPPRTGSDARWAILTPPAGHGAIAIVQLRAEDPASFDALLVRLNLAPPIGKPALRDLLGADRGLVIRWTPTTADLYTHAGPAILRRLSARLTDAGVRPDPRAAPHYPEAADDLEHRMLETLARAASPRAIDLLLDQPRRWREAPNGPFADEHTLARLVNPPLVVALGPANVGKSTLLNALAGRAVATVADQPGTTRDHVGAILDLGGLVVRYLDTPGLLADPGPLDREAQRLTATPLQAADLILLCGDPDDPCPSPPPGKQALRVCLRADRGEAAWAHDLRVEAPAGLGVSELGIRIRDRLVPPAALAHPGPWRFWSDRAP